MQTLKKLLQQIWQEHKFKYDPVNNADSMHQRSSSSRKAAKQAGGAEAMEKLGIEDEGPATSKSKTPLKAMDLVFQKWGILGDDEDTNDHEQ